MPQEPANRNANDVAESLRDDVRRVAYEHGVLDRHVDSRAQIYYAPWMEPYFPKGIGDFTADAYRHYCASVDSMVALATREDLEGWLRAFEVYAKSLARARAERELAATVPRQVGLYTSQRLADLLKRAAGENGLSLNALCERIIDDGVMSLRAVAESEGDDRASAFVADALTRLEGTVGNGAHKWVISVSPSVKARLSIIAGELRVSIASLTAAILANRIVPNAQR